MIAKFPGSCAACNGGDIFVGQDIVRDADGDWIHANIAECDGLVLEVEAPVCGRCNVQVPCWCDEPLIPESDPMTGPVEDAAGRALRLAKENAARDPFDGFL